MNKLCKVCNISFYVKPSHYSKKKYCSRSCMKIDYSFLFSGNRNPNYKKRESVLLVCIVCSNNFLPSNIYRVKKTCSAECSAKLSSKLLKGVPHTRERVEKRLITMSLKPKKVNKNQICDCGGKKSYESSKCKNCNKKSNLLLSPIKKSICVTCSKELEYRYKKRIFCNNKCHSEYKIKNSLDSNNPNWKGGKTSVNQRQRRHKIYKDWRSSIFKRDKYTCVDCGQIGGKLNAHHIKPYSLFPKLRIKKSNGKTVCIKCHQKYHPKIIII